MGLGKKKWDRSSGVKRLHTVCPMLGKPRVSVVRSGVLGLLFSKQWLPGDHPRDESTSRKLWVCAYVHTCIHVYICVHRCEYMCTSVYTCVYMCMCSGRSPKDTQKHAPGSDQGVRSMRPDTGKGICLVEHGAHVKNRVARREGLPELGKMIWTCSFLQ